MSCIMIEFENVSVKFNDKTVIEHQTFSVKDGEFFVLVGTSGSGKTTTLKMMNRLIDASEGKILIDGIDIRDYDLRTLRLNIGYVLQKGALFPNLTVQENIELIPEMKKWSKVDRLEKTKTLLDKVGLPHEDYMHRYPHELSGGEQQRVGILRAIIAEPKILLMDEPFSALDPIFKAQLQELIQAIHEEFQITTVFVTHDMDEAMKLGDRICVMNDGQILQIDTPEHIQQHPATEFVAKFFHKGVVS